MALSLIKRDPNGVDDGKGLRGSFLKFFERENEQKSFLSSTEFFNLLLRIGATKKDGDLKSVKKRV